jgi:hypothetical protein
LLLESDASFHTCFFFCFTHPPPNGLPFTSAGPLKLGQRFRYKSQQETKLVLPNIAQAFNNRIELENQNKTHRAKSDENKLEPFVWMQCPTAAALR